MNACLYIHICISIFIYECVRIRRFIYTHKNTHMHIQFPYVCIHVNILIYTYMHIYICIHT